MSEAKSLGQVARVLDIQMHPRWPNHVIIEVGAETFCCSEDPGFSSNHKFVLGLGERTTITVADDIFPHAMLGSTLDGRSVCYYKAREPKAIAA